MRRRTVQSEFEENDREDPPVPDEWNMITRRIIGRASEVHTHLGPGLLERLYEDALVHELQTNGISVRRQVEVSIPYKGIVLAGQRLDLVVERLVVAKVKAAWEVADVRLAQLVSYLRGADMPIGLLFNFHACRLKEGVFRRLSDLAAALRNFRERSRSISPQPGQVHI